jgi:hypothetical protein
MTQPNRRTRSLALVGPLDAHRRVTQTAGFPIDPSKILPAPDVILLVADADESAMLFRYTAHGEFAGDTFHPSVDAAREHAIYDYSDALGQWVEVPEEVEDAHAFAIQYAVERFNSRGHW